MRERGKRDGRSEADGGDEIIAVCCQLLSLPLFAIHRGVMRGQ